MFRPPRLWFSLWQPQQTSTYLISGTLNTQNKQIPSHKSYFYSNFLVPSLDHFQLLRKQALFYIRTRTSLFCIRPRTSLILGENHSPDHSCSGGTSGQEPTCNAGDTGDLGSIPGTGRSPRGGHINPLQSSRLGNPMNRGTWQLHAVHVVAKSWTEAT